MAPNQIVKARALLNDEWSPLREVSFHEQSPAEVATQPLAGDSNDDGVFDQLDIVRVFQAAKYLTHEPATWEEGDWNTDGVFDQLDVVAVLQTGNYLVAPHRALATRDSLILAGRKSSSDSIAETEPVLGTEKSTNGRSRGQ
jgi:hypothetical protein